MICLPFIIALIINIGSIIIHVIELSNIRRCKTICANTNRKNTIRSHITRIIANLIVIALTYVLCSRGYEKWSWFVVLLPFVLGFIYFLFMLRAVNKLTTEDVLKRIDY